MANEKGRSRNNTEQKQRENDRIFWWKLMNRLESYDSIFYAVLVDQYIWIENHPHINDFGHMVSILWYHIVHILIVFCSYDEFDRLSFLLRKIP